MPKQTNRYVNVFGMTKTKNNTPTTNSTPYAVRDRETDIYITYNDADRLDLVSQRVYGSPNFWWLILSVNGFSIEFDIESGDILRIPYPLNDVLDEIRGQVV